MVIAMSPVSDAFQSRLRMFPSLVNCCTVDWFSAWPADALQAVALTKLQEDADIKLQDDQLNKVVSMFVTIHQTVEDKSKEFAQLLGRYSYRYPHVISRAPEHVQRCFEVQARAGPRRPRQACERRQKARRSRKSL
eukprot:TRINITY_DN2533_c0_g1_i1.p1 TRINITY_DN2533_c0_g1~~TRINITY_DN2533_c0_g1_i1.p1  ORF type:complete len:151 (-),score=8.63 TRINITY_DN2533_c0_g1_i1:67-474(-)